MHAKTSSYLTRIRPLSVCSFISRIDVPISKGWRQIGLPSLSYTSFSQTSLTPTCKHGNAKYVAKLCPLTQLKGYSHQALFGHALAAVEKRLPGPLTDNKTGIFSHLMQTKYSPPRSITKQSVLHRSDSGSFYLMTLNQQQTRSAKARSKAPTKIGYRKQEQPDPKLAPETEVSKEFRFRAGRTWLVR
jgi:hypothetical protein